MMRPDARTTAFVGLAILGITFGVGVSPALAQGWSYGGTPGSSSSNGAWYAYPRANAWSGYTPSNAWSNYAPAPVPQPSDTTPWQGYTPGTVWGGYTPGTAWGGYAPAPSVPPGGSARNYIPPARTAPVRPYVPAPRVSTGARTRTPPAHYREFGSGRNVFMHKPWLPGQ